VEIGRNGPGILGVNYLKGVFRKSNHSCIAMHFRFQENRSCSKLIAQGLEEARVVQESEPFTPAQVGRALKRLGFARIVGKKTTQSKSLQNIKNLSDSENESGSDDQGKEQPIDTLEKNDPGSRPDEDMSEEENVASPSKRKGLLESLNEDSDDEDEK
jgi:hypothetical protein